MTQIEIAIVNEDETYDDVNVENPSLSFRKEDR